MCGLLLRAGLGAALFLLTPPAGALLNIDGSRNQVFVFGGVTFGYNSNIFAEAGGEGDYSVTAQAGAELKRRAGIIAVNATAKVDYITFGKYTGENSLNPSFNLALNKTTGRTTGALTINAYRETRSDSAVNLRTSSWNFPVTLGLKYPVNDKFYLSSNTGYLRRTYADNSALVDYTDSSESIDVYYTYTSKLDLVGGYRVRSSRTSAGGRTTDHWFNLGAEGGLLAKLSGSVRLGYQLRHAKDNGTDDFSHFNALASLTWPITRKIFLGLVASRDFNTIATGTSVDSASAALRGTYIYSRKFEFSADTAVGRNEFLGRNQPARNDTFFSWNAGGIYRPNEHLQIGATYTYSRNWSSFEFSDYDNHGFSIDISSRY
ncbi:MAG: outer membrane beta-barrel protein [Verrucomicrobiota bacterium]